MNESSAILMPAYDYIVCGAGSSGCVVASRLSENSAATVLLLEAGGTNDLPAVSDPRNWFLNISSERDWGYRAEPNPALNNRSIAAAMGKVLGGGSSTNATVWARGHKHDFDTWAEIANDPDWGYEHVLDVYRRAENWQGLPDPKRRGRDGPMWIEPAHDASPLAAAMVAAADSCGIPAVEDHNGHIMEGPGGAALANLAIRGGKRFSVADAYLKNAMLRPNLTVVTGAEVRRIILDRTTATAVELILGGEVHRVAANQEIILAMGAIQTPHVLMLSGVGDASELADVGIPAAVHLPGVGKNFQDHLLVASCMWEPRAKLPAHNNSAEATLFCKSDSALATPDLQPFLMEMPHASDVTRAQFSPPSSGWAIAPGLVRPKSRGYLKLRSADRSDRIAIFAQTLTHRDDVEALMRGTEIVREIGNAPAMREFAQREVMPGKLARKELEEFVRNGTLSYSHASGTCAMGHSDFAVVDNRLRVRGVDNLRIADASIMPEITTGNTMAPCVLIGERMAEILRSDEAR